MMKALLTLTCFVLGAAVSQPDGGCNNVCTAEGFGDGDCACHTDPNQGWSMWVCNKKGGVPQSKPTFCSQPGCECNQMMLDQDQPDGGCNNVCTAEGFGDGDCSCHTDPNQGWSMWVCNKKGGVPQSKPTFCSQPGCECNQMTLEAAVSQPDGGCNNVCTAEGFGDGDCTCHTDPNQGWSMWVCNKKGGVPQSKPTFCSQPGCECNQMTLDHSTPQDQPDGGCNNVCTAEGFGDGDCACHTDPNQGWSMWVCNKKGGVPQSKPTFCSQPGCECNQMTLDHSTGPTLTAINV